MSDAVTPSAEIPLLVGVTPGEQICLTVGPITVQFPPEFGHELAVEIERATDLILANRTMAKYPFKGKPQMPACVRLEGVLEEPHPSQNPAFFGAARPQGREFLLALSHFATVVVVSPRLAGPDSALNRAAVRAWLERNGMIYDDVSPTGVPDALGWIGREAVRVNDLPDSEELAAALNVMKYRAAVFQPRG